jgi:gp32 DNA binding protein like
MTINFEALKQNRKSNFDKLTSELNKLNSTVSQQDGSNNDDRFWKPDVDKAGNGYAIIRFLPAPAGEDMPFVRIWDHGFQGPGGWYIEKSLTTFNKPDPVSEMNTKLWNSGIESNKEIVRKQKRRLSYFSNILVIKDPTRPENEGKVFLFKYGKKIFDKINEAMHPQFQDEKAVNPFDFWDGANFKLKIRQVEGYRNYDKSEFDSPSSIANDDEQIKAIWGKQHSLQELLDAKHFKSYEELKMRLEKALGTLTDSPQRMAPSLDDEDEAFPTPQRAAPAPSIPAAKQESSAPWDEDDEDLSFFKKLASD